MNKKSSHTLHITTPENAVIGLISHTSRPLNKTTLDHYIKIVNDTSYDWLVEDQLHEVALRLLALSVYDKTLISGDMFAKLARRLLAAETIPGGPYRSENETLDILTNAAIAQLFITLQSPLSQVQSYLEKQQLSIDVARTLPFLWVLVWPYRIVTYSEELEQYIQNNALLQLSNVTLRTFVPSRSQNSLTVSALAVKNDIQLLDPQLHMPALELWESINKADRNNEISLLTTRFVSSLTRASRSASVTQTTLDMANFYAWMAYTKYDDFIDDEGDPRILPLANIFHRKAFTLFRSEAHSPAAQQLVQRYFDAMDVANYWEASHCRFKIEGDIILIHQLPRYGNRSILARRAGVHGLGPLVMIANDFHFSKQQIHFLQQYFQEYLIARQLNDDLHDWKEDIRNGHSSYVVTCLLRSSHTKPGKYLLSQLIDMLQIHFWNTELERINEVILNHANRALSYAQKSNLFTENSLFVAVTIQPIIDSVHAAQNSMDSKKTFLKTYQLDD